MTRREPEVGASPSGANAAAPSRGRAFGPARPRSVSWVVLGWAATAAALAVATGVSWEAASRLRRELDANRQLLAQLEQRLAEEQQWAEVLNAPGAKIVALEPTQAAAPGLAARATYDPATQRAVIVFEDVHAPAGRDYQLWALRGAIPAPASLGLVRADQSGGAVMRLELAGEAVALVAFVVSLEPAGGAPASGQPTGPVVMIGKLGA